jgi:hypothetical protein
VTLVILYLFSIRYVWKLDSWVHILWSFGFGLKTRCDSHRCHLHLVESWHVLSHRMTTSHPDEPFDTLPRLAWTRRSCPSWCHEGNGGFTIQGSLAGTINVMLSCRGINLWTGFTNPVSSSCYHGFWRWLQWGNGFMFFRWRVEFLCWCGKYNSRRFAKSTTS